MLERAGSFEMGSWNGTAQEGMGCAHLLSYIAATPSEVMTCWFDATVKSWDAPFCTGQTTPYQSSFGILATQTNRALIKLSDDIGGARVASASVFQCFHYFYF